MRRARNLFYCTVSKLVMGVRGAVSGETYLVIDVTNGGSIKGIVS
jgi:hypothetical protein